MNSSFSIRTTLSYAWEAYKKNPVLYTILFVIPNLVPLIFNGASSLILQPLNTAVEQNPDQIMLATFGGAAGLVSQIISYSISFFLLVGITYVSLRIIRGEEVNVGMLFQQKKSFIRYALTTLAIGAISIPAYLLFIIPGIIWTIATSFAGYYVVDKGMGPIEAIRSSIALTKGFRMKLFFWGVVTVILSILGAIPLLLGLLIVSPVIGIAQAKLYLTLQEK